MKLSPKIYAKTLIESLETKADYKSIAKGFWRVLQKNGQYKDMANIIEALDLEYAKKSGDVYAKVYSPEKLSEDELNKIKRKLKEKYKKDIWLKNLVKPKLVAGVVVKIDDKEIDLSLTGKINKLEKMLNS